MFLDSVSMAKESERSDSTLWIFFYFYLFFNEHLIKSQKVFSLSHYYKKGHHALEEGFKHLNQETREICSHQSSVHSCQSYSEFLERFKRKAHSPIFDKLLLEGTYWTLQRNQHLQTLTVYKFHSRISIKNYCKWHKCWFLVHNWIINQQHK